MTRGLRVALITCALALLLPAVASAANRRLAISNYQWSETPVEIDLGEHVTWYWVGPDTMHSITGVGPPAAGIDSDPGTNQPRHSVGDEFRVDFETPGTYTFQCKLHSTVRGVVEVSATPGDPKTEVDPVPKIRVDLKAPNFRNVYIDRSKFGRRGASLKYSLDEKARVEIEYFRFEKGRKRFAGYARHKPGHVGINSLRFGIERNHFRARKGRYLAKVTATDSSANVTRPVKLRFRIVKPKRR